MFRRLLLLACGLALAPGPADALCDRRPLVIAHRGASGDAPEHTLAAYELAILQGSDVIEPDLVMSRDGVLLARHENEIGATTDVASRPEFAARRVEKVLDGEATLGWWTEDFTWRELRTLRAVERIPDLRPTNTRFDGMFPLVRFETFLYRIAAANALRTRDGLPPLGIAPEVKHATHHLAHGLDPVAPLVRLLGEFGYTSARAPVWIQSFEVGVLKRLRTRTPVRLVQLIGSRGRPADAGPDGADYAAMRTSAGLTEVASYANAIGVPKHLVLGKDGMSLVRDAHTAGLEVQVWTFRAENHFLSKPFRRGGDGSEHGDLEGEVRAALARCVDAVFSDHPFLAVRARDAFTAGASSPATRP